MVMTCPQTSAEVRDVLFGEGRGAELLRPGQVWADMTTGDPGETREMAARLAEKRVQMIDAPVSGGPHGANAGTIGTAPTRTRRPWSNCSSATPASRSPQRPSARFTFSVMAGLEPWAFSPRT